MSNKIDENIVELEFDNSKFEGNVKQSMSTLDKLKAKLRFDGATKGLDEIEKASKKLDFSSMEKGIDSLNDKWSIKTYAMQQAIWTLTSDVIALGKRMVNELAFDQITAGWSKMDQMTGSVQTLVNSTGKSVEEINSYLDKLMWYSDETSFGFTDMTSALATMTSSGGDIEKLIPMIEGIANATAYAGKGAAEFSRVIYNLNQSYSAGALTLMDWKSVQLAGVNSKALMETLISVGEELGKIKKGTVDVTNFTETLKNKWADTEVMEKAFGKFASVTEEAYKLVDAGVYDTASEAYEALSGQFDEIAERAAKSAQEAKTFKEAIDSVKDAVSSKWLNIFATIFGDYNEQKATWTNLANDLWKIFAAPLEGINETLGKAFNSTWDQFSNALGSLGVDVDGLDSKFVKFIKDAGSPAGYTSTKKWADEVDELLVKYGSVEKLLSSNEFSNLAPTYVQKFLDTLNDGSKVIGTFENKLESLQKIYDDIWSGSFGNGAERVKKLTEAGIDAAEAQKLINDMAIKGHKQGYKLLAEDIAYLTDEQLRNLGLSEKEADELQTLAEKAAEAGISIEELISSMGKKSGQQLLSDTISNLTNIILNLKNIVGTAWSNVFDSRSISNSIYEIVARVENLTKKIRNLTEKSSLIQNVFESIFAIFKTFNSIISQVVRGGLSIIQKIFASLKIDVGDLSEKISGSLKDFADWMTENEVIFNFLDNAGTKISEIIDTLGTWTSALWKLESTQKVIGGIKKAFEDVGLALKDVDLSKLTFESFKQILDNISKDIQSGDLNPIESFSINIGKYLSNIGINLTNFYDLVKEKLKGIGAVFSDVDWVGIGKVIKKFTETMIGIAAGVGVFGVLSKFITLIGEIMAPIASVKKMINAFTSAGWEISYYFKELKDNIKTNNLIKIAIAIAAITFAFWGLAKLDWKNLLVATGCIVGIAFAFSYLVDKLTKVKTNSKNASNISAMLLSLAGSMLIIAISLKLMENVDPNAALGNLIILSLGLVSFVGILYLLKKKVKGIESMELTILSLAGIILILTFSIKTLSSLSTNEIANGIFGLIGAIGALYLVVIALKKLDGLTGKKIGLNILATAASLLLVLFAIKKFADMPAEVYLKGILALIPIFIAYAALCFILRKGSASYSGLGVTILAMSASMLLLSAAIKSLAKIHPEDLVVGGAVMSGLFIFLALAAKLVTSGTKNAGTLTQLLGVAAIILVLSASLFVLAAAIFIFKNMDIEGLIQGGVTVITLLLTMAVSMRIMAETLKGTNYYSAKVFTGFAIVLGVLTAAILLISNVPIENLKASLLGIVGIIGMMTLLMLSLKLFENVSFKNVIGPIVALSAILLAIAGVFILLEHTIKDPNSIILMAEGLTKVLWALLPALVALGAIALLGGLIGPAGVGAAGRFLAAVEIALVALEAVIAGTIYVASLVDPAVIDKAAVIFEKIGNLIGGFIGGIVSKFLTTSTNDLGTVGTNLSTFATNMGSFLETLNSENFSENIGDKVDSIAKIITTLGDSKFQKAIENLSGDQEKFTNLNTVLDNYATAIVNFSDKIKDIDSSNVTAASYCADIITSLFEASPRTGGWFQKVFGEKQSLSGLKDQLSDLGEGLVALCEKLQGENFDPKVVETASTLARAFTEIIDSLPAQGGLLQDIVGTKNLTEFGKDISGYVKWLVAACFVLQANSGTISEDLVEKARHIGEIMVEFANTVPETESVKSALLGSKGQLDDFGEDVHTYVTELRDACEAISEITVTEEDIGKVTKIGDMFNVFSQSLGEDKGILGFINGGKQTLTSLGADIQGFGSSLYFFCSTISNILEFPTEEDISGLERVMNFIYGVNANKESLTGLDNTSDFITKYGNAVKDLTTNLSDFILLGVDGIINQLQELYSIEFFNILFTETLNSIVEALKTIINTNLQLLKSFLIQQYTALISALLTIFSTKAVELGKATLEGLIEGLTSPDLLSKIAEAGYNAAETFNKAYRSSLDINSPSSVMQKNGQYTIDGLINGIKDRFNSIRNAGSYVGQTLNEALTNAIDLASATVENGLNPVITPVLDLSQIQNGANGLSNLLNNSSIYANAQLAGGSLYNPAYAAVGAEAINLNINFDIDNAGGQITEENVNDWAQKITRVVNNNLGSMLRKR